MSKVEKKDLQNERLQAKVITKCRERKKKKRNPERTREQINGVSGPVMHLVRLQ